MNVEQYLLIIKGEDKTSEIISYAFQGEKVEITYPNKTYLYAKNNVEIFTNPLDLGDKISLKQGDLLCVQQALKFDTYIKIFFDNGTEEIIPSSALQASSDSHAKPHIILNYIKDIANCVGLSGDDGVSLLTKELNKIDCIPSHNALYAYLHPNTQNLASNDITESQNHTESPQNITPNKHSKYNKSKILLFPFGSNQSQTKALYNAMTHQISVIEGPPGTGKTQTILNIIANLLYQGKSVAVVSNNNAATANVFEKLQNYKLEYLCATLGNKENKEHFITNQTGQYPELATKLNEIQEIQGKIKELNATLDEVFVVQNKIAKDKELLSRFELEAKYFREQIHPQTLPQLKKNLQSDMILHLKAKLESTKKLSLWQKLKCVFLYGIGDFAFYKIPKMEILRAFDEIYYKLKIYELESALNTNTQRLEVLNASNPLQELQHLSFALLQEKLREKYQTHSQPPTHETTTQQNTRNARKIFEANDLTRNPQEFIDEYPIIFSTTHSLKSSLDIEFDYLIIDEASQVDLSSGILALSSAKNAIIVGDRKQLPNVIPNDKIKDLENLSKAYSIPPYYDYTKHSLLSSILEVLPLAPKVLLKEHYRCHPKIIGFCNKKFYHNQLIVLTKDNAESSVIEAIITPKGNHARGNYNNREIAVITEEILPPLKERLRSEEIGIVAPYNDQKQGLQEKINDDNLQVDTIHKYQGREKEAIIITCVKNEIDEFINDPKMLNVAITRAKSALRLVVSHNIAYTNNNISDLIKYIQYHNFAVKTSRINSIFDLLYEANNEARIKYLKYKKKISQYDSENLIYHLIKDILEKNNFDTLSVLPHIPLVNLFSFSQDSIKNTDKQENQKTQNINATKCRALENGENTQGLLNKEEYKYALNQWTHIDFVIFNTMDKSLLLAIEVDGYTYHTKNEEQKRRDRLKDSIFEKYNAPLLRLSTIGSNEGARIESRIKEELEKSRD